MSDSHVRPDSRRLTDGDARHLLAYGLIRACHAHGPSRVARDRPGAVELAFAAPGFREGLGR